MRWIHQYPFVADTLGGEYQPCAMTLDVIGRGVERQYGTRASALDHARFLIGETTAAARGRRSRMMTPPGSVDVLPIFLLEHRGKQGKERQEQQHPDAIVMALERGRL